MRLRQIEVFQAVYINGSISGAARALHVSQPSVSKVLRHTETQLGLKLFELVKGRLVATFEAHQLFKDVDDVYRRISSLSQTARNLKVSGAGHLSIGVVASLGLDLVPKAIAEFRARNKDVSFEVQIVDFKDILRSLYEREFDMVICFGPQPRHRLVAKKIGTMQLSVFASTDIFPKSKTSVEINELANLPFVGFNNSGTIGESISNILDLSKIEVAQYATVGTFYIAAGIVKNCGGVTILDESTARAMVDNNTVAIKLNPSARFDLHVTWLDDRPLSTIGKAFIQALEGAALS